jgi:predicted ATPase
MLDDFEDGVFFVPLADLRDAAEAGMAIVRALGLPEPRDGGAVEQIRRLVGGRRMLLILDNVEQITDAAPLLADILAACPRFTLLVTSRSVLRVYGEHDFQVPPLSLPDLAHLPSVERLSQFEAVRLFIDRARAVRPDFQVTNANAPAVAEIAHRLDGLPLAIELAAARSRLLSPEALLARLERRLPLLSSGARDLPARQQTLRGAIAWGYDLLETGEQELFGRLSIFAGGFTLETAETVCDPDGDIGIDLFDGVAALVDKSLVREVEGKGTEPRFGMLATIREFGLEMLEQSSDATDVRRRFERHFRALAHRSEAALRGPQQATWYDRLNAEHRNFRETLKLVVDRGEAELAQQIAIDLWWFWYLRGGVGEGRRWIQRAIALDDGESRTLAHGRALVVLGILGVLMGDPDAQPLDRGLEILRERDKSSMLAPALAFRAQISMATGEMDDAKRFLDEAVDVAEPVGRPWEAGIVQFQVANIAFSSGDLVTAREAARESRALMRTARDFWTMAMPLSILGRIASIEGHHDVARRYFDEAVALRRTSEDGWNFVHLLNGAGDAARLAGDLDRAREIYVDCLKIFRRTASSGLAGVLHNLAQVAIQQGRFGDARGDLREAVEIFDRVGDRRGVLECVAAAGALALATGDPTGAARLVGGVDAELAANKLSMWPTNLVSHQRTWAALRAALSPDQLEMATSSNSGLDYDGLLTLAMDVLGTTG